MCLLLNPESVCVIKQDAAPLNVGKLYMCQRQRLLLGPLSKTWSETRRIFSQLEHALVVGASMLANMITDLSKITIHKLVGSIPFKNSVCIFTKNLRAHMYFSTLDLRLSCSLYYSLCYNLYL